VHQIGDRALTILRLGGEGKVGLLDQGDSAVGRDPLEDSMSLHGVVAPAQRPPFQPVTDPVSVTFQG
jgi:hypothetical protein